MNVVVIVETDTVVLAVVTAVADDGREVDVFVGGAVKKIVTVAKAVAIEDLIVTIVVMVSVILALLLVVLIVD